MITYIAAASIFAWVTGAFIALNLAVGSRVSGSAVAGIAPLTGIGAAGSILAWFMVGAVVQVLVAEQATPAFLAGAFKWLRARSVQTAGVSHTLITEPTLPSHTTFAFPGHLAETMRLAAAWQTDSCKRKCKYI